ncbi:hypothetical protein BT67DRAFT_290761 [Trichocladium antarcticum]|uniref:C2H2-type domain-containing protein n=1 Tax=Trichocladium antarcticum TaxID=1450529 RepID=A0AAN6ULQ8_9PEZI|nr:hypothetical protein BT67DRAFT_290761 [Trichocladium antarcticum]
MAILVSNPSYRPRRAPSVDPRRKRAATPSSDLIHDCPHPSQEQAMSQTARTGDPTPANRIRSSPKYAEGESLPRALLLSSSAPHASQSSDSRQSWEWETETLVDPTNTSLDSGSLGKARAQSGSQSLYPCPFRKRNPVRFNVRDHERCAKAIGSISELRWARRILFLGGQTDKCRHHLILHHRAVQSLFRCPRCKLGLDDHMALEHHLTIPKAEMCEVGPAVLGNPEDGMSDEMHRALAQRHYGVENWTWAEIWRLLFPEDADVPAPEFQPVVELIEMAHVFDEGQEVLKAALQEKLRLLLPRGIDDHYCHFLAAQLDLVFETHRANMLRKCLGRDRTTEQQGLPNRTNRKSRRNTLLQNLQRRTSDPPAAPTAHNHTRTFSTRHAHRPPTTPPQFRSRKTALSAAVHSPADPTAAAPTTTSPTNPHDNNNPRDARDDSDTGISRTSHKSEQCGCSRDGRADAEPYYPRLRHRASQRAFGGGEHCHVQPRLSVRTDGLGGVGGGRFSPESFKQRVLRRMGG